jgi:hypothetical protein
VYPSGSEQNCGHVCIAVSGGNASTGTVDCHNSARQHKPLDFVLAGTADNPDSSEYSTFRVYHVTKSAAQCAAR